MMTEELKQGKWPKAISRNHPALSTEEQIRLCESTVVVVGLGGLGGYLSTTMARMGVGHLVLVDGDSFDYSNLNRQILSNAETIGKNKASVSASHCRLINPEIKTTVWDVNFTSENGAKILSGANLVLDGLDHIPTRKILFKTAMSLKIPFIHGAVAEWSGQTSTFLPESPFTLDQIYPGDAFKTAPPSVLSPAVGAIACLQSLEATRILSGKTPANVGKIVIFDGEDFTIHKVVLKSGKLK